MIWRVNCRKVGYHNLVGVPIINSVIKHLIDSGDSEDKGSVTNNEVSGDVARTVTDADKDVRSALSNIGQLSPTHPLVQRIQQDTGIQDPQLSYTLYGTDCTCDERRC